MVKKYQRIAVVSVGPGWWMDEVIVQDYVRDGHEINVEQPGRDSLPAVVLSIKVRRIHVNAQVGVPF